MPKPPAVKRCLAKAITTGNIINALLYSLEAQRMRAISPGNPEPTAEGLAAWEPIRPEFASIILVNLDFYDQKET